MQRFELIWPTMLHNDVAWCCNDVVERSMTSIRHLITYRSTILLFSCVNNKVALVWPRTSTLQTLSNRRSCVKDRQPEDLTNRCFRYLGRSVECVMRATMTTNLKISGEIIPRVIIDSAMNLIEKCWHSRSRSSSSKRRNSNPDSVGNRR